MNPIGIFDSGIGGLTIFKEIKNKFPHQDIIYLADTAHLPYGEKSKETIIKLSLQNILFLLNFKVELIIIACNTCSAVALPSIKEYFRIPILGVIDPLVKEALVYTKNKRIGVIGTNSTIKSKSFQKRLKELAYLNPDIKFYLIDERIGFSEKYHYKGGIVELVKNLNMKRGPIHSKVIYINGEKDNVQVEIALQYNSSYTETIYGYVNNIHTKEGGTHIIGFRSALTKAINRYISEENKLPKQLKIKVEGEDVREGLCAVISLRIPDPQFEGQTKMKLGNSEIKPLVESIVYEGIMKFLEENPSEAKKILQKIVISAKAREASKKARELIRKKKSDRRFCSSW